MVTQILLLKKFAMFWALSVNLLSVIKDPMLLLYTTLVQPIIEYNMGTYLHILDNQKLEGIQRKATKIIPSTNHHHIMTD